MSFSINTNTSAMVALQSLTDTTAELQATQKRIATGYRVADAKDDGAAYAVAERIRGDIAANQSANQQLGAVSGLLKVTSAAMQNVSNQLQTLQSVTVKLADGTLTASQRTQYQAQVKELTNAMKSFIKDASYNGLNILNDPASTLVSVVNDGSGAYYTFNGYKAVTNIYNVVSGANAWTAGDAVAALTTSGAVRATIDNLLTEMNKFGSYANYIDSQVTYNNAVMDAQTTGLGALVDADMAKEAAKLQAMQIRQQLGTQALSIANQAPQVLLTLFRG